MSGAAENNNILQVYLDRRQYGDVGRLTTFLFWSLAYVKIFTSACQHLQRINTNSLIIGSPNGVKTLIRGLGYAPVRCCY